MRSPLARQAVPAQFASRMEPKAYLAPTMGWVSNVNVAAGPEGSAHQMENFEATPTGVRLRWGRALHATLHATLPVQSLMAYIGGGVREMFGACNGSVFDITAPADPLVPPAAEFSGETNSYYSFQNFASSGGNTMTITNGANPLRQYDGAAWSIPVLSNLGPAGAGDQTNTLLDHVWAYGNRLWFTEKNTMRAYCLGAGSIAGAAVLVNLAGVFTKGGSLLSGATWSMDAGDGLDDKICFFSTEGEVAVYQGTNPADATTWALVGVYDITPPLGKRAFIRDGGELLIATERGLIPISSALSQGVEAAVEAAKSYLIDPDWTTDAAARRSLPWEIVKWPSRKRLYVTTPVTGTSTPSWCYVANTTSRQWRWSKNTNWDMRCAVLHNDIVYFGTNSGTVLQADIGGYDGASIFTGNAVLAFDRVNGAYSTVKQARALFRTANEIEPRLSVSTDFTVALPTAPNVAVISGSPGVWDVGLWDDALWDVGDQLVLHDTKWVSIGQSADYAFAPQIQISSGQAVASIVTLILIDLTYESGGLVV